MDTSTRVAPGSENVGAGFSADVINATESARVTGQAPPKNEWRSERGLILQLYKVPRVVVVEAGNKIKLPDPPKVQIADQDRWIENPGDPVYQQEVSRANYMRGMAAVNVYMVLGTRIKEVPPDMDPPDVPDWAETLIDLGVEIPGLDKPKARYAAWLKFYALNDDEFTELTQAITRYSGHIADDDVQNAEDAFRSDDKSNSDKANQTTTTSETRPQLTG